MILIKNWIKIFINNEEKRRNKKLFRILTQNETGSNEKTFDSKKNGTLT